ncbi:MAG: phosphoribosyltransferase [Gemmatimonadaceae bacterium]|nr:phosphoribosyltransferase [Gemmatimonadaceae bacterium]
MHEIFEDRAEAGRQLADRLSAFEARPGAIVLGLPRGGVPVAYEVAMALGLPLDVFVARKVGVPGHEELALGAVATGDVLVLNEPIVAAFHVSDSELQRRVQLAEQEVRERERTLRGDRPAVDVHGSTVILVDDGIATGATVRAAVMALRARGARRVVVASPVAAVESEADLRRIADEVEVVRTPRSFIAVGAWYRDFVQVEDDDVRRLLEQAAARLPEEWQHAAHRHAHQG